MILYLFQSLGYVARKGVENDKFKTKVNVK